MDNSYNHKSFNNWQGIWKDRKNYRPNYISQRKYCIVIPPPNITGKLHMGHAFQCTLMDILVRYYKMREFSVLWKFGTDHAGIATQILFEQKLCLIDKKLWNYRANILQKKAIKKIKKQINDLGFLVNWDTSRFTLDKHFSYAVRTAFIELYNDKLIYKATRLVNWDTKMQTAISDLEIIYKSEIVKLYFIKYRFKINNDFLIVATTRPETIFGDVAIAVNANDVRYSNFIGKSVLIPLLNKEIPIICDNNVDPLFGSGCLKITPAHDFKDFDIAEKHNLPVVNILTASGLLNTNVPFKYVSMNVNDARVQIIKDLNELGLCSRIENYKTKIPVGDRTGNIIEPFLTSQWYIYVTPLILPVQEAIVANKIKIIPYKWKHVFIDWMNNSKDWCISRQIWWGHRMPVWYDQYNNIYLGHDLIDVMNKYGLSSSGNIVRESDVLDTWFSSALWPFASLGWPVKKKEFKEFYPTNTLVTGFDIIFFWVIRMLMFGIKFTKQLPFREIYIHGLIRDNYGIKMSKTKGNVIDPLDIVNGISKVNLIRKQVSSLFNSSIKDKVVDNINKHFINGIKSYGVDALRLTLTSIATQKMSLKLDIRIVEKYKSFCNKIWNASNFLNINQFFVEECNVNIYCENLYDSYISLLWERSKRQIQLYLLKRNFSKALTVVYEFFWKEFCDWYIEIIKRSVKFKKCFYFNYRNAINIFKEFILVLHPFAPIITEQLWCKYNNSGKLVIDQSYPKHSYNITSKDYFYHILIFKKIVSSVRKKSINVFNKNNLSIIIFISNYKGLLIFEKLVQLLKCFYTCCYINLCYTFISDECIEIDTNIFLLFSNVKNNNFNLCNNTKIEKILFQISQIETILKNDIFLKKASSEVVKNKLKKLLLLKQQLHQFKL
ncbi:MAG TPA: valine--tRNA ligase [Candidatus Azoamicus sp. OHIO2]